MSLAIDRSPRTSFGAILQYGDETLPFPSKIIFICSEFVDIYDPYCNCKSDLAEEDYWINSTRAHFGK